MDRTKLKNYAPQARREFIEAMTERAAFYGLTADKTEPIVEKGDVAVIGGRSFSIAVARKRKSLEDRIKRYGFQQTMEAMAYTWFNRLVAIRYMELHGYLDHGYRVLSHPDGKPTPEILEHAEHIDFPGLKKDRVIDLKLAGNKEGELYRLLLTAQCNALHSAMPFLFERIDDETELLLPDNLLNSDSLIRKLVNEIDDADWQEVEIIGWLYQFYIRERYEEVIGKVVASEDIPAATQLFTPNWIVKYLVQNTLGRQWLATYRESPLRQQMEYYIEPAEQTPEVKEQLKAITPTSLNPEELTFLDPACGSGHILVEAYDLFKAIYQERGYRAKDIPALILQKNLFGLEIDDRAAQLAAFALMMKARADDRRIFQSNAKPNVVAIQESEGGLKQAEEIVFALGFESSSQVHTATCELHALFENAKTFGSLIQIPPKLAAELPQIESQLDEVLKFGDLTQASVHVLKPLLYQARLLARQYDAVVANPPYMSSKYYTPALKAFINKEYKETKADLYACFMERNKLATKSNGFHGMINIPNWMFLSSFEELRKSLFETQIIDTFVHNGRGVFGSDFGSCAFVIKKIRLLDYRGSFRRLFEKQGSVASNEELESRFRSVRTYTPSNSDFAYLPTSPIAYWISDSVRSAFKNNLSIGDLASPRAGLATGDNSLFQRAWHEVSLNRIGFNLNSTEDTFSEQLRWYPCNSGGAFRKWYGNNETVVDWQNDGHAIRNFFDEKGKLRSRPQNRHFYFKPGVTWTKLSSSCFGARLREPGFVFDDTGRSAFPDDPTHIPALLGLMCSNVAMYFLSILSPTMSFTSGDVANIPVTESILKGCDTTVVSRAIEVARADWDSLEESWGFNFMPLIEDSDKRTTISAALDRWISQCNDRFVEMRNLERANNDYFLLAYDLQNELSSEVPDDQITLYHPDCTEDIKRLLSFAIGCMMGRYSLDTPGLIYALSGNQGFDSSQYKTFRADDDGIIPLIETDWGIHDDATRRFEEFVSIVWPVEHLGENLKFVADSLSPNSGEQPREAIRHYLSMGFYKHHLSTYKNRPIYWLFSSGKQRAFQCLVYLHRYNEGTLARMRTEYVIPLQGQIAARIDQLEGDKAKASSTSHRTKIQKEQDKLKKQQGELAAFEEKLKNYADMRISLDLDDGVKVNYAKFGDLLAESKAITGGKDDECAT
jgi:type II restriction/modification system DNA methylase subunit YeeA